MQEALKKVTSSTAEPVDRTVTLCLRSNKMYLNGVWNWQMNSTAIYCSDVMSFPDEFIGTKAIIHPDDLSKLISAISLMEDKELPHLDFRIITTYGEVKTITGQRVFLETGDTKIIEPIPGKEPWEEALHLLAVQKENDFLQLRRELSEYTEHLHGIGSWLLNKETGQAWYSDNIYRIHGLAPQSLNAYANTFNPFLHREDRVAVLNAFEKAFEQQTPLHIEYRIVTSDGDIKYLQQITRWLYAPNGQPVLAGIVRDVTGERVLTDELLAEKSHTLLHQQLLKFSEQQIVAGSWYMNLATRKTTYSDNYYRIYGFKQQVIPSYNAFLNLVHADDREKVIEAIERMYAEHKSPDAEFRIVRPDGKMRYLKQSGKLFISPDKQLYMIGVVQDVTVQKGLEKKITELNDEIRLGKAIAEVMEASSLVSSIIWLPDGHMQWSDGFYQMLGYKPGSVEPLSKLLHKYIQVSDLEKYKQAETLITNHQDHNDILIRLISKAGTKQVKISFSRVDVEKEVVIGLVQDVSKQMAMLEDLKENKALGQLVEESVTDMLLLTNIDHTILHWNAAAEKKTGINKDNALYHNLFDVLPQLSQEAYSNQLYEALAGNEQHSSRAGYTYLRKQHNYRLLPFKNEAGEIIGVLHVIHDVSGQLELQHQLSERLNFIERLLESSVDRIVVLDRFMNYLYWNKKAEEHYGIGKERVIGKNILEVFPSIIHPPGYNEFRSVLRGETIYLPANADEETVEYAETYLIPVKDENNEVSAVLWIVHDLSKEYQLQKEKRKADEIITQQANHLQRIMQTIPDMVSILEVETGTFTFLNPETFIAYDFDPEELARKNEESKHRLVHPDDQSIVSNYFKSFAAASDDDIRTAEYRAKSNNGEWKWFLVRGKVFQRDEEGRVTQILNAIEDITQRKTAEEEVIRIKEELARKATDRYKALFNSIDEGFCIIEVLFDENENSLDHRFLEANNAFEKQTGLANVVGKTMKQLVPGHEQHWFDSLGRIAKSGQPERFESEAKAIGRYYEVYAFRVDDPAENRVAVLFNDVSDRKKVEENFRIQLQAEVEKRTLELNQSKGLLQTILDHSPIGICLHEAVYNEQGEVMDFRMQVINKQLQLLTGRMDLEGKLYGEEFPGIKQTGLFTAMVEALTSGQPKTMEYAYHHDGFDKTFVSMFAPWDNYLIATNLDISERKNAETEIQKHLTLLRYTENMAQSGSWEYDVHSGRFTWSEGMYHLFGLPQQMKVQPEVYIDFAVEEDRSVAKRIVTYLKKKYQPFEEEMRIRTKNGVRLLRIKSTVVKDEEDKESRVIGVDLDITNIKQAEEKLKESRHWLEQTTKASPDSITVYDVMNKEPFYLNNCLAEWTGICNDDLVKMGIEGRLKLIHPDDRLKLLQHNEKTTNASDGDIITVEYRIINSDNKTIWLRNRSKPFLRDASGKVTYILSVLQNVTEEVELREQLNERTKFAETILNASVDRITVFDRNYKFVGWNKRCEQIHGKSKEEVIGKTIFEMFPGIENYPQFIESQEKSLRGEFVHVPAVKDGYTGDHLELFYIPLKNESGETYAVVNVMHDVSDYVLSTEALNLLNKKLESKNAELEQKNEEITSFAFVASHDMKEPLRKIHTFSDWLIEQETANFSEKGKSLVEKINASVNRMEMLIDDILVLTKIHSETHGEEDVDLNSILQEVIGDMADDIHRKHTTIDAKKLPVIKGNSNQLFYLFKNLVSNAIKFQKPGSVPQVTILSEIVNAAEVNSNAAYEEYVKLSFIDNGFGFDQRYAKKIFQVFQRLHGRHEFEGTGIGLAICKKIVENHNGWITVKSKPSEGSVFDCYFPLR